MANYTLVSLSSKLSFIQINWGFDVAHLKAMMMGYESFMIEVGLYGNTMDYNFKRYSMLATNNTWFKNVWELVLYFNVSLNFNEDFQLKPIRLGDQSLMSKFLRYKDFGIVDIVPLNIMRMHKRSFTCLILFYPTAKQSSRKCSRTSLAILTCTNSRISTPHRQIYPYGKLHSAKLAQNSMISLFCCESILLPRMIFHDGYLATIERSSIT
jgi:hypothetical protein